MDYKKDGLIKLFIKHYKGHLGLFAIDMICAFMVSAIDLAFPYISRICMQTYLPEGAFGTFFRIMFIILAAYVLRSVFYYVITYWGHRMGVYIEADMRSELFEHIESLSHSYFDHTRTGELISRVTTDLFEIAELAHHGPEDIFISGLTLIGAFIILCTVEWKLALIVFAVIPVFVFFTCITRRKMYDTNLDVKEKMAGINSELESGFSGVRTAKAFANEDLELKKFARVNEQHVESKRSYHKYMAVFFSGQEYALSMLSVLVMIAGGYYIMKGSLDYVDLVTFSLYISTFTMPIRKIINLVEQYMAGMAGFRRFVGIMRTDPEIQDKPDAAVLKNIRGEIDVENVSFSYNDEAGNVLENISFHIPAGSSFALVGASGSGKTTMSSLIPRFYDVKQGSIKVDGHDVRDVTQRSLRKSIGIVEQDVYMFAGTVYDNFIYGRPEASKEEVIQAAKEAEIHDEIMNMPKGYDSYIGEQGVLLSGGQKQRIGIARVFLKNPPVIILDEATSALDSITEAHIQSAFDKLAEGRTSIIIAHRLSTIRNADTIAVIEDKHLVEAGTHDELMKLGGKYAKLVEAQKL